MAIRISFDGNYLDSSLIMDLSKSSRLFDSNFSLGATLCNSYSVQIKKDSSVSLNPSTIILENDDGSVINRLYVDNIDTEDEMCYTFSLVDGMIKFNQYYDWSSLTAPTVQTVLNAMCYSLLGTTAPTVSYIGSMSFPYTEGVTCREFVSYIAEINGCFARINRNNVLEFVLQKQTPTKTISINTCADVKIGTHFKFDRVVLNNGVDTVKYPSDSEYTGTGNTLYLNPDNILISDSSDFTMAGIVQHIYGLVNGLEFYNFTTSQCQFNDAIVGGEMVGFSYNADQPLITQNSEQIITQLQEILLASNAPATLNFIAQYDWTYNTQWKGGFELDVVSEQQEETKIVDSEDKIRRLSIKVDKANGAIEQEIASTNGNITRIIQDASSLTGYFKSAEGARYVKLSTDGIKVSQNPESDGYGSVNITENGVYIKNDDNTIVAEMKANEFDTTNWIYSETRNGNCLNIYKRRV